MKPLVAVALAACVATTRQPQVVPLPTSPPPGPWSVLRDALTSCAYDHGLTGELRVRIDIFDDGGAGSVASTYGDSFDGCVGRSIDRYRFSEYRGRLIDVPFTAR